MDNRTAILDQALILFTSRGYDAVGVQEIVLHAGITKPTLYHYFGSKRGLLEALIGDHFGLFNDRLRKAAAYNGDLPFTLNRIASAYFSYAREDPVFYRLWLGLWFAPQDSEGCQVVQQFSGEQFAILEMVFRAAVAQHGNMRGRHAAYAATFSGMLNTYIGLALNGLTELDASLAEQAVHQFQHGIYS
jgi:TetR/AcrR family transcriptional regulator